MRVYEPSKTELRIRDSFSVIGILFMFDYLQDEFGRWKAEFRYPLSTFAYEEISKRFENVHLSGDSKTVFFSC